MTQHPIQQRKNRCRRIVSVLLAISTVSMFVVFQETSRAASTVSIDFEDGTLGLLRNDSDFPWVVVIDTAAGGTKSLKSGPIGHSGGSGLFIETYLELTVDIAAGGGTIQFARKYTTESGYDYFRFYVDDMNDTAALLKVSGSAGWAPFATPFSLSAGVHTLRWSYKKDNSVAPVNDGVWIDDIAITNVASVLPPPPPPLSGPCTPPQTTTPSGTPQATGTKNLWGYAWSPNIGWIHFGATPGDTEEKYRVRWNTSTEKVEGYAWSPNIGWIRFDPSTSSRPSQPSSIPSGAPAWPTESTKINKTDGILTGWARIQSYIDVEGSDSSDLQRGGWRGWIKMRGCNYGVTLNRATGVFQGYVWSSEIGWIQFDPPNGGVFTEAVIPPNAKPATPALLGPADGAFLYDYTGECLEQIRPPMFSWSTYSDTDSDAQQSFAIHFRSQGSGTQGPGPWYSVTQAAQSITECTFPCNARLNGDPAGVVLNPAWDTTYEWQVQVTDARGLESEWSSPRSFRVPMHSRPTVDFIFAPPEPAPNTDVQFTSRPPTTCYTSSPVGITALTEALCPTFRWDFGDGTPATDTQAQVANPIHRYTRTQNFSVKLEVTDADGYKGCKTNGQLRTAQPLPLWRKITPF